MITAPLLLMTVILPLASLLLALRPRWQESYRYSLPLLPLPAILASLIAEPHDWLELPWLLIGGVWGLDELRQSFLLLTSLLWATAGIFAIGYLNTRKLRAFCVFWTLTLTGNLGLIISVDLASFYSFFALMTFAAYGLVVHDGTDEANRAGRVYLAMAVAGEMALLTGLLMAAHQADSTLLTELPGAIADSERSGLIIAFLVSGFGVKAGLPILHFWLPLAHPVAPTPASAVLSGAMIKAGLLGWLVTLPFGELPLPAWGNMLVVLGATGALGGAILGLKEVRPKTILAYSSISQMGLITLMVGAAISNTAQAATLLSAIALYALHHGLAKGCLFLSTAVELPAERRFRWLVWLLIGLPGLSLAGLPFTSGAAAKFAMKDSLKPEQYDFAMAEYLPLIMSAGAVATMLLIWRFLWALHQSARTGHNHPFKWLGWVAATVCSLVAFWFLPGAWSEAGHSWFAVTSSEGWSLIWPIALATAIAGAWWFVRGRNDTGIS
ncbi:complex I subunit 5 family protein [Marinobacter sp. DUT-1]|uniref:complex I subunit 5 family protein n=1 Tax=Marinobacter sp. DUT-1 TaxID=3412037 RepID=UPI003D17D4F2